MTPFRALLIVTGLLGAVMVVRLAAWPIAPIALADALGPASPIIAARKADRIPADSVNAVVARDPFRLTRRPVIPPYDPLRLVEQLAPPAPRPVLLLVGMIDGASPSGIVEGLPGVDGSRIVRAGDVIGGLTIKRVARGQVVITGMDTTWVLEVREPWRN